MTFAELLHKIVDDTVFGGRIDVEEAHKAIDTQFPTPLIQSETVAEPEAQTPPLEIPETPETPEPVVPTPGPTATV